MTPKFDRQPSDSSPAQAWQAFIAAEKKNNSKIGNAFSVGQFAGFKDQIIQISFKEESAAKKARGLAQAACQKLPQSLRACQRIECKVGEALISDQDSTQAKSKSLKTCKNPLAAIHHTRSNDSKSSSRDVFQAASKADQDCQDLYQTLNQRLKSLAGDSGQHFTVTFPWRLRVGGQRGFDDLLMPVLHPVFGVPYIPSASLKGAARAWARRDPQTTSDQIDAVFGFLNSQRGQAAKVEILDAFPVRASLSTDVSTPQWHWKNDNSVRYQPEPHYLLSLYEAEIAIAVKPTKQQYSHHVPTVVRWLKGALNCGIGSRVSSGYGQAVSTSSTSAINPHNWQTNFQIWTQGMHGSEPPAKANQWWGITEFRPTALRGILRYWFRAVALGLYAPSVAKDLETQAFGDLSIPGAISLNTVFESHTQKEPYFYQGCLQLEASSPEFLEVARQLTILAAHLGGFGRGTRRPLHLLHGKMRGCHWELDLSGFPLPCEESAWEKMFLDVKKAFESLNRNFMATASNPGDSRNRFQDVLDNNSQVWLIQSTDQIHPSQVKDWKKDGSSSSVRGEALNWFYTETDPYFKGQNRENQGNSYVGGKLGTPSFAWIRSLFPTERQPYQVVTLFGRNSHPDRRKFAEKIIQRFQGQVKTISLPF